MGENSYFILRPGFQVTLEGEEDGENIQLTMSVLDETKVVDEVETSGPKERLLAAHGRKKTCVTRPAYSPK
jgi:hypothetical protein